MTGQPPEDPSPRAAAAGDAEDANHRELARTVRFWRLPVKEVWLHYFSLGGTVGEYELDAYINTSYTLSSLQHDILAHAINELIGDRQNPPRTSYRDSFTGRVKRERESDDE